MGLLIAYGLLDAEHHALLNTHLQRVLWCGFVATVTIVASAIVQHFIALRVAGITEGGDGESSGDATTLRFLSYLANFVIYALGITLAAAAFPALRTLAQTALAGAGVLALVVGVASQEGIANIVSGMLIVAFRPFRVGDVIEVEGSTMGRVEDITLRHTVIKDFQNQRVVVPNANLNKADVTNYHLTDWRMCEWVVVGVAYGADLERAIEILRETAADHPYAIDRPGATRPADAPPAVDVHVMELADSAVTLRASVWAGSFQQGFELKHDVLRDVKRRYDEAGIGIPFPQRTLSLDAGAKRFLTDLIEPTLSTLNEEPTDDPHDDAQKGYPGFRQNQQPRPQNHTAPTQA